MYAYLFYCQAAFSDFVFVFLGDYLEHRYTEPELLGPCKEVTRLRPCSSYHRSGRA